MCKYFYRLFYVIDNIQFFSSFVKVIAKVIYNIELILKAKLVLIEIIYKF